MDILESALVHNGIERTPTTPETPVLQMIVVCKGPNGGGTRDGVTG